MNATGFTVTVAKGLEPALLEELAEILGPEVAVTRQDQRFHVAGSEVDAAKVCLWSQVASRVLWPIGEFEADSAEKLYGGIRSFHWPEHLAVENTFAVDFVFGAQLKRGPMPTPRKGSPILNSQFGALKTKDAICDQFRSITGARPNIERERPDLPIHVYWTGTHASVSLDFSGGSLHERGYRTLAGAAPLKENLAAGLLRLAGWRRLGPEGGHRLHDLMCGAGTFLIEGAIMALGRSPGMLRRSYYRPFGFERWAKHDPRPWRKLMESAKEAQERAIPSGFLEMRGWDQDREMLDKARANAGRAGVDRAIEFGSRRIVTPSALKITVSASGAPTLSTTADQAAENQGGSGKRIVIVNPPYGERLGESAELEQVYADLGATFKKKYAGWDAWVLAAHSELSKKIGLRPEKRLVVWNGPIECRLLHYPMREGKFEG